MSKTDGWITVDIRKMDTEESETVTEDSMSMPIPSGYKELQNVTGVFISDNKIVVTGEPDEDDESHNCDEMGCSSISHVIFRANI